MSQFTLSITLGNDAMRDAADVSAALTHVARVLEDDLEPGDGGRIFDINGNRVGDWSVS